MYTDKRTCRHFKRAHFPRERAHQEAIIYACHIIMFHLGGGCNSRGGFRRRPVVRVTNFKFVFTIFNKFQ